LPRRKSRPSEAFLESTRYKMQQHGKTLRPKVLAVRSKIPRVFGDNTYVYAAIAANGAVLRETDINASLAHAAVNSLYQPDREALGHTLNPKHERSPAARRAPQLEITNEVCDNAA
jgi:hypothetical protein